MNKLYSLATAALLGGMTVLGGPSAQAQHLTSDQKEFSKAHFQLLKTHPSAKQNASLLKAQPQTIKIYASKDGYDYDWILSSNSSINYDQSGRILVEKNSVVDTTGNVSFIVAENYTYDKYGNMIENLSESSVDGLVWTKDSKKVMAYDTICKHTPVLSEQQMWDETSGSWILNEEYEDGFFLEIERDSLSRTTKTIHWVNRNKPLALLSLEFSYGEDGKANTMKWNGMDKDFKLTPQYIYEDLQWKETNHQFLSMPPTIYYPFELDQFNVLKSFNLYTAQPDSTKGQHMANYHTHFDDLGRTDSIKIIFGDSLSFYECLYAYDKDENGSFDIYETNAIDENRNGVLEEFEYERYHNVTIRDQYHEIIAEYMYYVDIPSNSEIQTEGYRYELTYDKNGLLIEQKNSYLSDYFLANDGYSYINKIEFSDYTGQEATAIESVNRQPATAKFEGNVLHLEHARGAHYTICDLQGKNRLHGVATSNQVDVSTLPKGMYILKLCGKNIHNSVKLLKK